MVVVSGFVCDAGGGDELPRKGAGGCVSGEARCRGEG